jgi:very-short-patch-repair endonuclease
MPTRYLRYRATLRVRAQSLRRDPTPAERKLWFEFLRELPQKFTRQKPLGRYIADFYCSSCSLVVELDGDSHFTGTQSSYDALRTEELNRLRLRVIRFTNADVLQRFEAVCGEISRVMEMDRQS